jgi:hypothetical protein
MILLTDEAVRLPRTLDLNPCDFLWGHLKQPIYSQPVNLVEELTGRVVAAGSKFGKIVKFFQGFVHCF